MKSLAGLVASRTTVYWEDLGNGVSALKGVHCELGEGLFLTSSSVVYWFDIAKDRLLSLNGDTLRVWDLPCTATAGFSLDEQHLMIATDRGVVKAAVCEDELQLDVIFDFILPDQMRTNDGKGDLQGGLWFSSMSREQPGSAGSVYRYFDGEVREIASDLGIPNSICLHPSGDFALFSDTVKQRIYYVKLNQVGWPKAPAQRALDLNGTKYFPDGATFDSQGRLYVAMWGSGKVVEFGDSLAPESVMELPSLYTTCPAIDPVDENILWVTTADPLDGRLSAYAGGLFRVSIDAFSPF